MPVILSFSDTHFEWTTDELVMKKLSLNHEKFEQLILMWTYPLETIDRNKDLLQQSEAPLAKTKNKQEMFNLKALYNYPVIFDCEAVCRTMEKDQKMPKEIDEIMGRKLPQSAYL